MLNFDRSLPLQLSQYKSAVFYGPVHSGKSYLVQRLAQCLAVSVDEILGQFVDSAKSSLKFIVMELYGFEPTLFMFAYLHL